MALTVSTSPQPTTCTWSSLAEGSAQMSNCCVYEKPEKIVQYMHGNISFMFDCWADPVVHLLLLKSFMSKPKINTQMAFEIDTKRS